jgi:maltooligosyltrehalose synthase
MIPALSWQNSALRLPSLLHGLAVRDVISGNRIGPLGKTLPVAQALASFPVALLTTE